MSIFQSPHDLVIWALFVPLTAAVVSDISSLRIPNRLCLAVVALYPVHVLTSPIPVDWMGGACVAAVVLMVATIPFALGYMGGGDVKLLAAVALWAGPAEVLSLLVVTSVAGTALSLFALSPFPAAIATVWPPLAGAGWGFGSRVVPYGVAIAVGGFFVGAILIGL